jgi:hypothetical protein
MADIPLVYERDMPVDPNLVFCDSGALKVVKHMGKTLATLGGAMKTGMQAMLYSRRKNVRGEIRIHVCFMRSFPSIG